MNKIVVCFFCVAENRWFAIPWNTLHLFGGGKKKMTALKRKTGKKGDWFGSPTPCLSHSVFLSPMRNRIQHNPSKNVTSSANKPHAQMVLNYCIDKCESQMEGGGGIWVGPQQLFAETGEGKGLSPTNYLVLSEFDPCYNHLF